MKQSLLLVVGSVTMYVLCGTDVQLSRQRILFVNEAPESVLVWIGKQPLLPRVKDIIQHGEGKWLFPPMLTPQKVLWIRIDSSQSAFEGSLHLSGSGGQAMTYACRAYGSVELVQGGEVIASIGAGTLDRGLVLLLTPEYKLELFPLVERGPNRRWRRKNIQRAAYLDLPAPFCWPCDDRMAFIQEIVHNSH